MSLNFQSIKITPINNQIPEVYPEFPLQPSFDGSNALFERQKSLSEFDNYHTRIDGDKEAVKASIAIYEESDESPSRPSAGDTWCV